MKENEKQAIEEMAKVLEFVCDKIDCNKPQNCDLCQATRLYDEGYRKQSEGEWIVDGNDLNRRAICPKCKHEYSVQKGMLQLQRFPYCPNCGAKMKGCEDHA